MGRWFAVTAFFDADTERFKCWYVDFERPPTRTAFGIDTRDLFLDVVVKPDFSILWKDEGEYDQAVALGLLTGEECQNVAAAREDVVRLVADRALLRGVWEDWRRDKSWNLPAIPPEVLRDISGVVPSA
jgi:predicted RNA-binding protein associated with RNAse of E/G family